MCVCLEHFPLQLSQLPKSWFKLLPPGGKQPIQSETFVSQLPKSKFKHILLGENNNCPTLPVSQLEQGGSTEVLVNTYLEYFCKFKFVMREGKGKKIIIFNQEKVLLLYFIMFGMLPIEEK